MFNRSDAAEIAEVVHATLAAYAESIGEGPQPKWADMLTEQKQGVIDGVIFCASNSYVRPSEMHDHWLNAKLRSGWKYGERKDPDAKTHPCLLTYDQLPAKQRVKDVLFINLVDALNPFRNGKETTNLEPQLPAVEKPAQVNHVKKR